MAKPSFHVFDRKIKPSDKGVERVYTLLTPFEARYLRGLLGPATPGAADEVNKASLDARLRATAEGRDPLQSGEQAFYQ